MLTSSRASSPSASSRLPPTPPATSRFVRQCPSLRMTRVLSAYSAVALQILIGVYLVRSRLARRLDLIAGQCVIIGLGSARFDFGENCQFLITRSPACSDCMGVCCCASLPNCRAVGVWISVGFRCKERR